MSEHRCPDCQSPLADGGLDGLCPRCLAGLLFDVGPAPEAEVGVVVPRPAPMSTRGVLLEVPGYEVTKELARGGMGIVYRATQLEPRREVALKMLLPHQLEAEEFRERFLLEARAIARLEHPGILPMYQVGEHDGVPFFTMKLAAGGTLAERRTRYRRSWREIVQLVATLAEAVQYAHERGVLHRDLKPGNVLFDDGGRPYVSDFGLAKLNDDSMPEEEPGQIVGTPKYVAPEVAGHGAVQATVTADIYGLGVILYELLAQKPPFNALSQIALLRMVEHAPPPPPSHELRGVPYELDVVALRCLEKDPARRFQTAGGLAQELRRWLSGEPIESIPATRREQFWRWVRQQRLVVTLTAALAVLGLVLVVGSVWVAFSLAHSRRQVVEERDRARNDLVQARLGEARGLRLSGSIRMRDRALELLSSAARVDPRTELRDEAAAILGRWEVGPEEARHRHTGPDMPIDLSPGFDFVLDAASTGEIRFWRRSTSFVVWSQIPEPGKVPRVLEFSPGAHWAVAVFEDGLAVVYDVATGREMWRAHAQWAGFSGDDLEFGYVALLGRIEFRNPANGHTRHLPLPADTVGTVRLTESIGRPDYLIQSADRVEVLDGADGHRRHLLPFTRGEIRAMAWRDNILVAGDNTGGIRVWNLRSGQMRDLTAHRTQTTRLVLSPDASLLWSASGDGVARLWNPRSGQLLASSELWRPVRFNAESGKIAYLDGPAFGIAPMLPPVGVSLVPLRGIGNTAVRHVEFSPDGQWIVAVQQSGVYLLDTVGNIRVHLPSSGVVAAHFDPHGHRLLVIQRLVARWYAIDDEGRGTRLVPGEAMAAGATGWLGPAGHFDASGSIAMARGSGNIGLLDPGKPAWKELVAGQTNVTALDTDTDQHWLATEANRVSARVTAWGRGELSWQDSSGAGVPLFSPDGRHLLLVGGEMHRVLSVADWRTRLAVETGAGNTTPGLGAWSTYGRVFAVAGPRSGISVISTESWQTVVRLSSTIPVTSLALGPHGRMLAAGTDDDHLLIWSLPELREALKAHGPLDWRDNLSPEGQPIASPKPAHQSIPDSLRTDWPQPTEILPRDPRAPSGVVNLETVMNRPLESREGSNDGLREVPTDLPLGVSRLGGVDFEIRGVVQMSSRGGPLPERKWPARVTLPLPGKAARRMHLLLTTRGGAELPVGTPVMRVRCRWSGGAEAELPVRLGVEVGNGWHAPENPKPGDRADAAWQGISEASETARSVMRLYRMTIEAPGPGMVLEQCELASEETAATPMIYAVSVE